MMLLKERKKHKNGYIPITFEALMESFGLKIKRKSLYKEFLDSRRALEPILKNKKLATNQDLIDKVAETTTKFKKLLDTRSAEPCSLKNEHN